MARQEISITTDCVIFFRNEENSSLLLVKRKNDPFKDQWALPGGFLEINETLEAGALRELQEETGLKVENLQQIKAFGALGRDPRGRTISIAFMGEVTSEETVAGSDDAADAKWWKLNGLPELAFDHSEIVKSARDILLQKK